ncbi:MAG: PD40 domain-containing protein [Anaerolineales bacterium]|nr:PD40 domain-containing protein [Anaerolineales bacterium]
MNTQTILVTADKPAGKAAAAALQDVDEIEGVPHVEEAEGNVSLDPGLPLAVGDVQTVEITMNKQPSFLFSIFLLLAMLAACTSSGVPTPRPFDDDDDGGERNGRYDLTNSEGIQEAYEAITRDRVEADDYCFKPIRDLEDVAIIGTFAYDYGCMFNEAIVVEELGDVADMTQPALLHNGWADPAKRETLAQIWAEDGLLAEFGIINSENEDFLKPDALPFSSPTLETRLNGDIEYTLWVGEPAGMLPQNTYRQVQILIAEDGELLTYERLAQFSVEMGPFVAPTAPVTATPEGETEATVTPEPIVGIEATKIPQATAVLPTTGLQQDQPWIVLANFNGIFAANGDGTALTQLSTDLVAHGQNGLLAQLSPDGQWLAYVTAVSDTDPILKLIKLRSQTERIITPLLSEISLPPDASLDCLGGDWDSDPCQAYYTVGPMAWSPDGSQLAFIGAQNGPTSDLYVYDLAEDRVRQLTDGPAHAANPIWSPDGQYIFHQGVLFISGSGETVVNAAWSARADGSGIIPMHGDPDSIWETVLGWQGDHTILLYSEASFCGKNLRTINVATGETQLLWERPFLAELVTYSPEDETVLLEETPLIGCSDNDVTKDGFHLINVADGSQTLVPAPLPDDVFRIHWEQSLGAFAYADEAGWRLVFPDRPDQLYGLADVSLPENVSLAGSYGAGIYAWHDRASEPAGLWVYNHNNPAAGVALVKEGFLYNVQIIPEAQTVLFFDNESPTTLFVATAPEFVATTVTNGELRGRNWDSKLFWSLVPAE